MYNFVEKPNLPIAVQKLVVGEQYRRYLEKALERLDIEPIWLPNNPHVDKRLSGHVDLSLLHLGGKYVLAAPYLQHMESFLQIMEENGIKILFSSITQKTHYPYDVGLNICAIENIMIYNPATAAPGLCNHFQGYSRLLVKQGYTKCAVCIVNGNSIITSDRGITQAAANMSVLQITPGKIALEGFSCGFIGGCSFLLSDKHIAFTGTLDAHPDYRSILHFLESREVEPVFLTANMAFDIGGTIPLIERYPTGLCGHTMDRGG